MRQLALRLRDDIAALERRIGDRDTGPAGRSALRHLMPYRNICSPASLAEIAGEAGLTVDLVVSNQVLSLAQRTADIALRITSSPTESLRGELRRHCCDCDLRGAKPPVPESLGTLTGIPWVGFDASLACSGPGTWVATTSQRATIRFPRQCAAGCRAGVRSGIGCGLLPCFVGGSTRA